MDEVQDRHLSTLLRSAQAGDQNAYTEFLLSATTLLRKYLSRKVFQQDLVEDVLQETLLAIHKARHTFIEGKKIGPWMYTIANYKAIDCIRSVSSRKLDYFSYDEFDELAQENEEQEFSSADLQEALEALPEQQCKIIQLLKIDGFSVKEVAQRLNLSEANVKVIAHRGYSSLKRWHKVRNEN